VPTEQLIMWAVVLLIGVPSAWRNPTSAALIVGWIVAEGMYRLNGNGLAVEYLAFPDIFVLAVIMAKREYCNLRPYRNTWHQLKCVLFERSPADRFIMLCYPLVWALYIAAIDPYYQYWGLYFLAIAQFLAAGWESFLIFRRHAEALECPPDQSGPLLVAYPGGGWSG
jgi:hypothetical protein